MSSQTTTDHKAIRKWAESKGGKPAAVRRTHEKGDTGIIRIEFPDNKNSHHENLEEISWDEFFEQFDKRELAFVYDEHNLFNKLVSRETAESKEHGGLKTGHAGKS